MQTEMSRIERGFDDEYYLLGDHITEETAQHEWNLYTRHSPKLQALSVAEVEHLYYRKGILPDGFTQEPGMRGWWVVDKPGRGVGKLTHITLQRFARRGNEDV